VDPTLSEFSRQFAGEVELPGELNVLRNLLLRGQIVDDEGNSITVTPRGEFELRPVNSPWSVRGSAGEDPSLGVNYQSRRPEFVGRSPETALDEALLRLRQEY
jgi:hypothetical protein